MNSTDGSSSRPAGDVVFSGHNPLTRQFLRMLPQSPTGSILELCAGNGTGAIASARLAPHVVATDITPRSVHFGRFNAWLNGCSHVEWQTGDLYGAVPGRTFDRIVAHPPYVPTLAARAVYRDGGTTGEQVLQGVVAGVPAHLAPGGQFMMLCIGLDTETARFEERARAWLGDAAGEFDVIFGFEEQRTPEEYARLLVERTADAPPEDFPKWRQLFADLQVSAVVYGVLAGCRRVAGTGPAETRRVRMGDGTRFDAFEWLFRWLERQRQPDHLARVLAAVPRLSSSLRLDISYQPESGSLVPCDFRAENTGDPFPAQARVDPQIARLLTLVDGQRTGREVASLCDAASGDAEPPDALAAARTISNLAERGMLLL
jgi:methylase of polypeptide subunit release factors